MSEKWDSNPRCDIIFPAWKAGAIDLSTILACLDFLLRLIDSPADAGGDFSFKNPKGVVTVPLIWTGHYDTVVDHPRCAQNGGFEPHLPLAYVVPTLDLPF